MCVCVLLSLLLETINRTFIPYVHLASIWDGKGHHGRKFMPQYQVKTKRQREKESEKMKIQIKWNIWSKFITRKITENEHETSLTDKFEPNNEKTTKRASGSSGKGFIAF